MSAETDDFAARKFSGSEVIEALSALPEELAQGVIESLGEVSDRRKANELEKRTSFRIAEMAIAAHVNVLDNIDLPEMFNVIMWDRFANDTSSALVRLYGTLNEQQRASVPIAAMDWASYRHIKHEIHTIDKLEEEIDEELLPVGVTLSSVYRHCLDLMVELKPFGDKSLEELQVQFPDPSDFAWSLIASDNEFDQMLEKRMREALAQAGFVLPELETDNTYGQSDDGRFKIPDVNESMYPTS